MEQCAELKNLNYKSMLLTGKPLKETRSNNSLDNLDAFLENEKQCGPADAWCKLNKATKLIKLTEYAVGYVEENEMNADEQALLIAFFKDCLDRKKLQRVKDVNYDKTVGIVKDVNALVYANGRFMLKNIDKRASALSSLKTKL
jgi:hypothetical protein